MDRRGFFGWLSSLLAASTAETQPTSKPEPCITPAYAGFDGSFLIDTHSGRIFRVCRCYADNPKRWGVVPGMMAVWRNRDESISKMVYRNRDGKLFDLQFVPTEEPT